MERMPNALDHPAHRRAEVVLTPQAPARGAPFSTGPGPPRVVLVPDARPPILSLSVTGYAVSDYEDFDRAGDWLNCPHGPDCPNRAYLIELYPNLATAHASIEARGE